MKKYFKIGIGTIVPIALVVMVLNWIYGIVNDIVIAILPTNISYEWWFVFPFIIIVIIIIFLIGIIFSFFKPLRWIKKQLEKNVVERIPVVKTIYNFGVELVDSFVVDSKEDGPVRIVETMCFGTKMLGLLTNPEHDIISIPTTPNPLNGFLVKTEDYIITDMTMEEFLKIIGSMGKICGSRWK